MNSGKQRLEEKDKIDHSEKRRAEELTALILEKKNHHEDGDNFGHGDQTRTLGRLLPGANGQFAPDDRERSRHTGRGCRGEQLDQG